MRGLEFLGRLQRELAGFERRQSQEQMLQACEEVIHQGGVLLVEAPPGVGKTFAYAIPAILSGKKTLISTRTINLQEQLSRKDLPLLAKVKAVKFALAKGYSNYLCLLALRGFRPETLAEYRWLQRLSQWSRMTQTGDREELIPSSVMWRELAADPDGCLRKDCELFERCFYFRAREAWFRADLIIANHSLLAADAALFMRTGQGVLPKADVLIIDEAHDLDETFSQAFVRRVSRRNLERLIRQARTLDHRYALRLSEGIQSVEALMLSLFERLQAHYSQKQWTRVEPKAFVARAEAEGLLETFNRLIARLEGLFAEHPITLFTPQAEKIMVLQLRPLFAWLQTIAGTLFDLLHADSIGSAANGEPVRWVECNTADTALCVAPLYPREEIQAGLIERFKTVILTSATLGVGGDFSYLQNQLGIEGKAVAIDSSFDYSRQAKLFVHEIEPPAAGALDESYLNELTQRIKEVIQRSEGGALVLFTNVRVLEYAYSRLKECLGTSYLLLRQGEEPRQKLLERFKADGNAVLLGLDSFWQGIDVPGPALRNLIIARLPFEVPDDPLHEARVEHLKKRDRDPFEEYTLPRAALRLKQGFGRLIRTQNDYGEVHILDGRLLSRRYGRKLLSAFPTGLPVQALR